MLDFKREEAEASRPVTQLPHPKTKLVKLRRSCEDS